MTLRLLAGGGLVVPTADAVANLIEAVTVASGFLGDELDVIATNRAPVSEGTALRLEALATRLRPAARSGARLGGLQPVVLEAGVRVWLARRVAPAALEVR